MVSQPLLDTVWACNLVTNLVIFVAEYEKWRNENRCLHESGKFQNAQRLLHTVADLSAVCLFSGEFEAMH